MIEVESRTAAAKSWMTEVSKGQGISPNGCEVSTGEDTKFLEVECGDNDHMTM